MGRTSRSALASAGRETGPMTGGRHCTYASFRTARMIAGSADTTPGRSGTGGTAPRPRAVAEGRLGAVGFAPGSPLLLTRRTFERHRREFGRTRLQDSALRERVRAARFDPTTGPYTPGTSNDSSKPAPARGAGREFPGPAAARRRSSPSPFGTNRPTAPSAFSRLEQIRRLHQLHHSRRVAELPRQARRRRSAGPVWRRSRATGHDWLPATLAAVDECDNDSTSGTVEPARPPSTGVPSWQRRRKRQ